MESNKEILSGGTMNEVEQIGDTVHRKANGHPMLHLYLLYLEQEGMHGVPRFLGMDEHGREILTYLPGKTDYPHDYPCLHSDETLIDVACFMRKLHDISAGFVSTAAKNNWLNPFFPNATHETICHCDFAFWNWVFVNDRFAGVIDFDQAYPGRRAWDFTTIMFSSIFPGYYEYDTSSEVVTTCKRRMKLFFDAYGTECPSDLLELTVDKIQRDVCDWIVEEAAKGNERCIDMLNNGGFTHYQNMLNHFMAHGQDWI